mgnify:CR=1 FL=1
MKSTKDIPVPEKIVDQVVGQEEAVKIIRKAAHQRRHVLLIGDPGTGKSMLGLALAELLPRSELQDTLAVPNPNDENNPQIQLLPAGKGREEVKKYTIDARQVMKKVHETARSMGCRTARLTSHPTKTAARALYKSLGYIPYSESFRLDLIKKQKGG